MNQEAIEVIKVPDGRPIKLWTEGVPVEDACLSRTRPACS